MNEARKKILDDIRSNLNGSSDSAQSEKHLLEHRRGIVPRLKDMDHVSMVARFVDNAKKSGATVTSIQSLDRVGQLVAEQLNQDNLGNVLRTSTEDIISQINWQRVPDLEIYDGAATKEDKATLTSCLCGVAETGTLVLISSEQTPTTLNFLPEVHIVLVTTTKIVNFYEDAWDLLRKKAAMPRTVNFITGPSRTGDIEQKILMGAHGPKKLHIILYNEGGK